MGVTSGRAEGSGIAQYAHPNNACGPIITTRSPIERPLSFKTLVDDDGSKHLVYTRREQPRSELTPPRPPGWGPQPAQRQKSAKNGVICIIGELWSVAVGEAGLERPNFDVTQARGGRRLNVVIYDYMPRQIRIYNSKYCLNNSGELEIGSLQDGLYSPC